MEKLLSKLNWLTKLRFHLFKFLLYLYIFFLLIQNKIIQNYKFFKKLYNELLTSIQDLIFTINKIN